MSSTAYADFRKKFGNSTAELLVSRSTTVLLYDDSHGNKLWFSRLFSGRYCAISTRGSGDNLVSTRAVRVSSGSPEGGASDSPSHWTELNRRSHKPFTSLNRNLYEW